MFSAVSSFVHSPSKLRFVHAAALASSFSHFYIVFQSVHIFNLVIHSIVDKYLGCFQYLVFIKMLP